MYHLEILTSVGIQAIVIHSLPKEHLPLTPEARLGIESETSSLLVSPVCGLPAQVSIFPAHVGACVAGGQGPAFMELLFYGEDVTKKVISGLPEELVPHGV